MIGNDFNCARCGRLTKIDDKKKYVRIVPLWCDACEDIIDEELKDIQLKKKRELK